MGLLFIKFHKYSFLKICFLTCCGMFVITVQFIEGSIFFFSFLKCLVDTCCICLIFYLHFYSGRFFCVLVICSFLIWFILCSVNCLNGSQKSIGHLSQLPPLESEQLPSLTNPQCTRQRSVRSLDCFEFGILDHLVSFSFLPYFFF